MRSAGVTCSKESEGWREEEEEAHWELHMNTLGLLFWAATASFTCRGGKSGDEVKLGGEVT